MLKGPLPEPHVHGLDSSGALSELAPEWSSAWNTLGRVELAERDFDAAVASFERATEENEDNSWAWNNLGFTLIQQDNFEDAAAALERATSGDNVTGYMWNNLGMAYEQSGWNDKAIEEYDRFLELWGNGDPELVKVKDTRERLARLIKQS